MEKSENNCYGGSCDEVTIFLSPGAGDDSSVVPSAGEKVVTSSLFVTNSCGCSTSSIRGGGDMFVTSSLISEKQKIDFGQIVDLIPLERGRSGRICRLKIVGTQRSFTIGKELEIRRTLSPTHLYSSAFVVDRLDVSDGVPARFRLIGAGWGHGVGLCQIGAAVMGEQGFAYNDILLHYYQNAEIKKIYK